MATYCDRTSLEKFRSVRAGWHRVQKVDQARAVRVVRCNYCGYFHIVGVRG